jgi:hypothetical protein
VTEPTAGGKTLQPMLEGHLNDFLDAGDWYARV